MVWFETAANSGLSESTNSLGKAFPLSLPSSQPSSAPLSTFSSSTPTPANLIDSITSPSSADQNNLRKSETPTVFNSNPSIQPSWSPSRKSTAALVASDVPSASNTAQPSQRSMIVGSSSEPSHPVSELSIQPSPQPQCNPTPSSQPTVVAASSQPTVVAPSSQPVFLPTTQPTTKPSEQQTGFPSSQPICEPSSQPSVMPTEHPSGDPSRQPTGPPVTVPSVVPSSKPSEVPTWQPILLPSIQPIRLPSEQPIQLPTKQPSMAPSEQPIQLPTIQPILSPLEQPILLPTVQPIQSPSEQPSMAPTAQPILLPSAQPIVLPSMQPSMAASAQPSSPPSERPHRTPSAPPSSLLIDVPSTKPTKNPSNLPSKQPTVNPSSPSCKPSAQPSAPSSQPTGQPTIDPSGQPTIDPSGQPSGLPSCQPSSPTSQPSAVPSTPSSQPTSAPSYLLEQIAASSLPSNISQLIAAQVQSSSGRVSAYMTASVTLNTIQTMVSLNNQSSLGSNHTAETITRIRTNMMDAIKCAFYAAGGDTQKGADNYAIALRAALNNDAAAEEAYYNYTQFNVSTVEDIYNRDDAYGGSWVGSCNNILQGLNSTMPSIEQFGSTNSSSASSSSSSRRLEDYNYNQVDVYIVNGILLDDPDPQLAASTICSDLKTMYFGRNILANCKLIRNPSTNNYKDELEKNAVLAGMEVKFWSWEFFRRWAMVDLSISRIKKYLADFVVEEIFMAAISGIVVKATGFEQWKLVFSAMRFLVREAVAKWVIQPQVSVENKGSIGANLLENMQTSISFNRGVVIIAHSQGNFYANMAFEQLTPEQREHVRFVAIATPASFVGVRNRPDGGYDNYLTRTDDRVISRTPVALTPMFSQPSDTEDEDGMLAYEVDKVRNTFNGAYFPMGLNHAFYWSYLKDANTYSAIKTLMRTQIAKVWVTSMPTRQPTMTITRTPTTFKPTSRPTFKPTSTPTFKSTFSPSYYGVPKAILLYSPNEDAGLYNHYPVSGNNDVFLRIDQKFGTSMFCWCM
jgi:hypothetical protein